MGGTAIGSGATFVRDGLDFPHALLEASSRELRHEFGYFVLYGMAVPLVRHHDPAVLCQVLAQRYERIKIRVWRSFNIGIELKNSTTLFWGIFVLLHDLVNGIRHPNLLTMFNFAKVAAASRHNARKT
jgi:hypothetical protein